MDCVICKMLCNKIMQDTFKCTNCGHIYRKYTGDGIDYHTNVYRKKCGLRESSEVVNGQITDKFHKNRHLIVTGRLKLINKYLNKSYNLLDVGAGAGTFAKIVQPFVNSVECTELSPILLKECDRLGFKTYNVDFSIVNFKTTFNIITIWHVLEHIENLSGFVKKIKEICNNIVIIEIPTLTSKLCKKVRQLKPPNEFFDGHYHYFTIKSLKILFSDHFNIIEAHENGCQKPCLFMVMKKKEK